MMTKHKNTSTWRFVVAAGIDLFGSHWRRPMERLLGIQRGNLRWVLDCDDMPEHIATVLEERIMLAFSERHGDAREVAVKTGDAVERYRGLIANRVDRRMRQRLDADPSEKAVFRELVMTSTLFADDAERAAYEQEYS